MANIRALQRLLLIIRKLKRAQKYVQTKELLDYLNREQLHRYGSDVGTSLRNIQRDILHIDELFGIEIKHLKSFGYYIDQSDDQEANSDKFDELLMNFEILNLLGADSDMRDYVIPEHHRVVDSEKVSMLIRAIKDKHIVEFDYTFYRHDNSVRHKICNPHFLKESNHRWYLLAIESSILKSFAVDRIENIEVNEDEYFERQDINIDSLFKSCYGIWMDMIIPIDRVVLSYDALDGSFLKSLPLHHSQRVLIDTEQEFRVEVNIKITNDFVIELLSRSRSLQVIEPLYLRQRIESVYRDALERNKTK